MAFGSYNPLILVSPPICELLTWQFLKSLLTKALLAEPQPCKRKSAQYAGAENRLVL